MSLRVRTAVFAAAAAGFASLFVWAAAGLPAFGEKEEHESADRRGELEADDRVEERLAETDVEARKETAREHGRADQPDVHGSSLSRRRTSTWRRATLRAGSIETT